MTELEGSLVAAGASMLRRWFDSIKDGPFLPLPPLALAIGDLHEGDGGPSDPMKRCGKESAVLELHREYLARGYEIWHGGDCEDDWRFYNSEAHSDLTHDRDVLGNHELGGLFDYPEYLLFQGFGKKILFYHGHKTDLFSDQAWRVGREAVRWADKHGYDKTGAVAANPTQDDPNRHLEIREAMISLANDYPDWDIVCGHTHYPEANGNLNNWGSPVTGRIHYVLIEEGRVSLREWT